MSNKVVLYRRERKVCSFYPKTTFGVIILIKVIGYKRNLTRKELDPRTSLMTARRCTLVP